MDNSKNEKIFELNNNINTVKEQNKTLVAEISKMMEKIEKLQTEYQSGNVYKSVEELDAIASEIDKQQSEIDKKEAVLKRKDTLLQNLEEEKNRLSLTPVDKLKNQAWSKYKELQPKIEEISEQAKRKLTEAKGDLDTRFNKDVLAEKFENFKKSDKVKVVTEKAQVVKDEIKDLNGLKMLGQLRKNMNEAFEDVDAYVKNSQIEKEIKNKIDKYVTPETKAKFSSLLHRVKSKLDSAAEVITDNIEVESEAQSRERKRRFKETQESYLEIWIKKYQIKGSNTQFNSLFKVHDSYVSFMKEEYYQDRDSKLVLIDQKDFVKCCSKLLNLPVRLNTEDGTVNIIGAF